MDGRAERPDVLRVRTGTPPYREAGDLQVPLLADPDPLLRWGRVVPARRGGSGVLGGPPVGAASRAAALGDDHLVGRPADRLEQQPRRPAPLRTGDGRRGGPPSADRSGRQPLRRSRGGQFAQRQRPHPGQLERSRGRPAPRGPRTGPGRGSPGVFRSRTAGRHRARAHRQPHRLGRRRNRATGSPRRRRSAGRRAGVDHPAGEVGPGGRGVRGPPRAGRGRAVVGRVPAGPLPFGGGPDRVRGRSRGRGGEAGGGHDDLLRAAGGEGRGDPDRPQRAAGVPAGDARVLHLSADGVSADRRGGVAPDPAGGAGARVEPSAVPFLDSAAGGVRGGGRAGLLPVRRVSDVGERGHQRG
jgi:hypothetical protein